MQNIYTKSAQFPKNKNNKRYKIIINAGGGLFGYVITYLMSHLDFDLYSKIDVVSGSSIGGILSLLYAVNSDYKYINQLFKNHGKDVFQKKLFSSIRSPKYDNKNLQSFIKKVLADYTLSDITKLRNHDLKVIIPTLDMTLVSPRIFSNIFDEYDKELANFKLAEIGLMTSAAPTYFPVRQYNWNTTLLELEKESKLPQYDQRFLLAEEALKRINNFPNSKPESAITDSGVIENIPVFTTYTTLKSRLGVNLEDMDVLILGTGDDFNPNQNLIAKNVNKWNLVQWLLNFIIKYVTESNELTSINFGAQMGFHSYRVYNPINVTGEMDDPKVMKTLQKQLDPYINEFKETINAFLNEP